MPTIEPLSPQRAWRMPVCVVMTNEPARHGAWEWQNWRATEIIAGAGLSDENSVLPVGGGADAALHTGFVLELFRDSAEDYWYNLISDSPSLYVVCHTDDENEDRVAPFLVTATHDEAAAHMETDDPVFALPMPPAVHDWVERYVVENYVPSKKKKRKRT